MNNLPIKVIKVFQPIGEFYIASMTAKDVLKISTVDRMRMKNKEDEITEYTGIQRKLDERRVKEIQAYVETMDASFPTSILMSVTEDCANLVQSNNGDTYLTLKGLNSQEINSLIDDGFIDQNKYTDMKKSTLDQDGIAKILDGQHRLAGLDKAIKDLQNELQKVNLFNSDELKEKKSLLNKIENFQLNVAIFIGYDIHSQAMLFSRVNLAQTKVNSSLVYNLETYSTLMTPQKIAHNITKIFDENKKSPFFHRIKMLGYKTAERKEKEFLTQAVFVEALVLLLSKDPNKERDIVRRMFSRTLEYTDEERKKYVFNKFMQNDESGKIVDIIFNYFSAISKKWHEAWNNDKYLLSKNNCFRAFMLYLRTAYNELLAKNGIEIPSEDDFAGLLKKFEIKSDDFNTDVFPHGDGGMSKFYKYLMNKIDYTELMKKRG